MARNRIAVSLAAFALVVAACGSGAATAAPATPAEPAATAAPAGSVAPAESTSAATASCEVTPDAAGSTATISGFAFPANLTVAAGGAITWDNADSAPHTVTFSDGTCDSGTIAGGGTVTVTYSTPGSYPFVCRIHPQMTGTLTVEG